ncbi:hypothetical protein Ndes2437B_g00724 [Nannochloris sp. 'desiccata']
MPRCRGSADQGFRGVDRGLEYRFFGGKIIVGPDYKSLAMSTLLILVPSVIYFVFVAPYLGRNISWACVAVAAVLVAFVFLTLGMTAFRDPGFIPRSPLNNDVEFGLCPSTRDYFVNGYTVTTKFCATCCHYRPPRCSHCAVCDNCVDRFDHHCPWVGTCVGRRNYRTFFLFVTSTALLCCLIVATCVVQLWHVATKPNENLGSAISRYPASLILILYCFGMVWFVGGLSCFHVWLMGRNVTTYEHFRHRYSNTGNPYSLGMWKNFGQVLCTKVPPRWEPLWEKQRAEDEAVADASASQQQQQQSQSQSQQHINNGTNGDVGYGGGAGALSPNYHDGSVAGGSPTASSYALYDGSDGNSSSENGDGGHVMGSGIAGNGQGDIELGVLTRDGQGDFSTPVQTPRNSGTLSPLPIESAAPPEDVAALEFLQSPRPPAPHRGQ